LDQVPDWRSFVRRHWGAGAILGLSVALAFILAVYVFLWFVGNAESSGMVPGLLGLWTMANLVAFILKEWHCPKLSSRRKLNDESLTVTGKIAQRIVEEVDEVLSHWV
jgi:hypothetical protein